MTAQPSPYACPCDHRYCAYCDLVSHVWVGENYKGGGWEKQRTFAFEERECRCCGHFEARPQDRPRPGAPVAR